MDINLYYLFIIFIWAIYFLDNIYLSYKMKYFWPHKKIEEIFLIPFHIFYFFLLINIFSNFKKNTSITLDISIVMELVGILFCLIAVSLFIYVNHFEKSFPSCLTIKQNRPLKGIYNYVRHPSYIVFFLLTFGTAFYLNDIFLFFLAILNHISLNFLYMVEENKFAKEFPLYKEYLKKTKRFFPVFPKKKH